MDSNELLDPFNRLLEDVAPPSTVRAIEAGGSADALWESLTESGFLDALVPESAGGAGLSLADMNSLLQALGRYAVPVPVAETMVARALLASAGQEYPAGPIVLAVLNGQVTAPVPFAQIASHALVECGEQLILTPLSPANIRATEVSHSLAACLFWQGQPEGLRIDRPAGGLRCLSAVLKAADIAGAADRLLDMTTAYANERVQFGKPIGKQQAIQQQLAVMAEQVVASRIASQIGCTQGLSPSLEIAATAKHVTSSAAVQIANIAHAVHGAIGISEEYDLQLYTRRMREFRLADGSEGYWAGLLGGSRLANAAENSVDFIRQRCG